jgi:hypothetical protein
MPGVLLCLLCVWCLLLRMLCLRSMLLLRCMLVLGLGLAGTLRMLMGVLVG